MIVDAKQPFHERYVHILEDTDYEIIHAYDGEDALAILEEKRPDLVIT